MQAQRRPASNRALSALFGSRRYLQGVLLIIDGVRINASRHSCRLSRQGAGGSPAGVMDSMQEDDHVSAAGQQAVGCCAEGCNSGAACRHAHSMSLIANRCLLAALSAS